MIRVEGQVTCATDEIWYPQTELRWLECPPQTQFQAVMPKLQQLWITAGMGPRKSEWRDVPTAKQTENIR